MNILNENFIHSCSINKEIEVKVMAGDRIQFCTYLIVANGRIVESKTISLDFSGADNDEYVHNFTFTPTFGYAPKIKIIVYYVKNRTIISTTKTVKLYNEFKNFIELNVLPNPAKPSQDVDISVISSPKSFIGLLGVDKSALILRSGNDLTEDKIWDEFDKMLQPQFNRGGKRGFSPDFFKFSWQVFTVIKQNKNKSVFSSTI